MSRRFAVLLVLVLISSSWALFVPAQASDLTQTYNFSFLGGTRFDSEPRDGQTVAQSYTLAFPFVFYGTEYTSVRLGPGILRFDAGPDGVPFSAMTAIAPNHRQAFVVDSLSVAVAPDNSWMRFRWIVQQPTGNSNPLGQSAFDALLFSDGSIRFDYGADTIVNTGGQGVIGISRGGLSNSVIIHEGTLQNTNFRQSVRFVPAEANQGLTASITTPRAGKVYVGGSEAASLTAGSTYAIASGSLQVRATATGGLGGVASLRLYAGDRLLNTSTTASVEATWTPPSAAWLTTVIRVVAIDAVGNSKTSSIHVFATSTDVTLPTILAPVVHVDSPNGGEWTPAQATLTTFQAESQTLQFLLSRNGGADFSPLGGPITRVGPAAGISSYPLDLRTADSAEAILEARLGAGKDRSDANFTIDNNELTARVVALPGPKVDEWYTEPARLDVDSYSISANSKLRVVINGTIKDAMWHFDEMETAVGWQLTQSPGGTFPVETDSTSRQQGRASVAFGFQTPPTLDPEVVYRRALPATGVTGTGTAQVWVKYDGDPATFGAVRLGLLGGGGSVLASIAGTAPNGVWTRIEGNVTLTAAPTTLEIRLKPEIVPGATPPYPLRQTFRLDAFRLVNATNLVVDRDGTTSIYATASGRPRRLRKLGAQVREGRPRASHRLRRHQRRRRIHELFHRRPLAPRDRHGLGRARHDDLERSKLRVRRLGALPDDQRLAPRTAGAWPDLGGS